MDVSCLAAPMLQMRRPQPAISPRCFSFRWYTIRCLSVITLRFRCEIGAWTPPTSRPANFGSTSTNPACLTSETTDANPNPVFDAAADRPAETAADSGAQSAELADASIEVGPEGDAPADVAAEGADLGPDGGSLADAPTDDAQDAGDGGMGPDGSADSTVE